MSVIEQNLLKGEVIIHRTRQHKIVLILQPVSLVIATMFVFFKFREGGYGAVTLLSGLGLALASFFGALVSYLTSEAVLTSKRVLTKSGFVSRKCNEILFTKVEAIDVNQNVLGRIAGYGTIVITGTGGTKNPISTIPEPFVFRKKLQEHVSASQSRPLQEAIAA